MRGNRDWQNRLGTVRGIVLVVVLVLIVIILLVRH